MRLRLFDAPANAPATRRATGVGRALVPAPVFATVALACIALASLALLAVGCGPSGGRGDMPPGWSDKVDQAERSRLRVVVFCDDPTTGARVLELLRQAGYSNPGNYVHPTPNRDYNIKWGGASEEAVSELAAIVGSEVKLPLERMPIFEPGDPDVFINLPVQAGAVPSTPVEPSMDLDDKGKGN